MNKQFEDSIRKAYDAFNARDIEAVLKLLHASVHWPNGWEGGSMEGHEAVREYWERQWKEVNPAVTPLSFGERQDGQTEVMVLQIVKDLNGTVVSDGIVKHVYSFEDGLIKSMTIERTQVR